MYTKSVQEPAKDYKLMEIKQCSPESSMGKERSKKGIKDSLEFNEKNKMLRKYFVALNKITCMSMRGRLFTRVRATYQWSHL